jgi:hypothetical protein
VVTGFEELHAILEHFVPETVGQVDAAGPHVTGEMLEQFRLALDGQFESSRRRDVA